MPPFALVLCSIAAVLGACAVSPDALPADLRAIVWTGCVAMVAYACFGAREHRQLRVLMVAALVGAVIAARSHAEGHVVLAEHRTARYAGIVTGLGSGSIDIALDSGPAIVASLHGDIPPLGSHVIVRGRLAPFDESRNPGEPSERAMEFERGLDGRLEAASILAVTPASSLDARTWLPTAHAWAHAQLAQRLGEPAASVLAGELWGERGTLPPDLRAEFQQTGTVHILVTAGLHLTACCALCVALLSLLALPRWLTCALAIACTWAFVWWSGAQLPAVRAASMATAVLAARACGRATLSWNALAIAAMVMVFARPQSVDTASFALSFSCVGAIFAWAAPLERWIEPVAALPHRVREALVLTVATQIGTWPLTAAVFLQFAPYAVFANLAVVPCVALTMALGIAQLAFAWCDPLARAFANLNSWPLAWVLGVVHTLAAAPDAAIAMTPAPAWCIALYDLAIVAAPWLIFRQRRATVAGAIVVLATCLVLWPPRANDSRLRITVLDVGQADSIVIETPAGHAFLIDGGGRLERGGLQGSDSTAEMVGERIVVPFLLRHGIHALDAVILSHPHGDHAGGCRPVLEKIRVAEIADSGQVYGGHAYHDCLDRAVADHVPIVHPRAGDVWHTDDGITLTFIGPMLPFISGKNAINDNSIAFILQYRQFRTLFTGDAGSAAEQRFLAEGIDLHADVLKVGHHGSAYSSSPEFITAVNPRYAIISVGRHNLFGHPALSTIATLKSSRATVYRTDENGAVAVNSSGASEQVEPLLP